METKIKKRDKGRDPWDPPALSSAGPTYSLDQEAECNAGKKAKSQVPRVGIYTPAPPALNVAF